MAPGSERSQAWARARNVLCVRLDNLGDVLMTAPAIRALRKAQPGRRITLLASASGVEASALVPEIDAAIRFDAPWMKSMSTDSPRESLAMRDELAARGFDAAVIFTVYSQSPLPAAMLCHLAGIPLRLAHCRENPYALLTDWIPETEPGARVRHEVQRQLDLVACVGATSDDRAMRIAVPEGARASAQRILEDLGAGSAGPLVVLHPGATASSRMYPAERFAQIASTLVEATGATVVVTGSARERATVQAVCASPHVIDAAGRFTLAELCALIEHADLLISNNTGPVHIASSVGTPVVDLYALTNPQHTPWNVRSRVLFHDVACRYCYRSVCPHGHNLCLKGVTVQEVVNAALELLACDVAKPIPLPARGTRRAGWEVAA